MIMDYKKADDFINKLSEEPIKKSTHSNTVELFMPISKSKDGKYLAVLSDDSLDRYDEIIGKEALDKLRDDDGYIVALLDHDNKVLNQVAEWVNREVKTVDGHTALVSEPKFYESNPNAKIIKGMLDEGARIGVSIGAIPKSHEMRKMAGFDNKIKVYTDIELLEASFVAIPANSHASAMAIAKSFVNNSEVSKMSEDDINKSVNELKEELISKLAELRKDFDDFKKESVLEKSEEPEVVVEEKKEEESEPVVAESDDELKNALETLDSLKKEVENLKSLSFHKAQSSDYESLQDDDSIENVKKGMKAGKLPVINQ